MVFDLVLDLLAFLEAVSLLLFLLLLSERNLFPQLFSVLLDHLLSFSLELDLDFSLLLLLLNNSLELISLHLSLLLQSLFLLKLLLLSGLQQLFITLLSELSFLSLFFAGFSLALLHGTLGPQEV